MEISNFESFTDSPQLITFGERRPDEFLEFNINWKLPEYLIDYIETSCGSCTKATYEDGNIKVTLDLAKAGTYTDPKTIVEKHVLVWLAGGNHFISNDKKQKITNPNKNFLRFKFVGSVVQNSSLF